MKKRMLSLLCVLALCLGLLPTTALAAGEDAPDTLWVGETQITRSGYWTTDANGKLSAGNENNYNVYYDGNGTLTLNGATINGAYDATSLPFGAGIYAQGRSNQAVALTIELIGTNTITGIYGIYLHGHQGGTVSTNASLSITGDGSLTVTGTTSYGLQVISGTGNASLTIEDASVVASSSSSYSHAGVCVQSGADATNSPELSLAVNGGSLTASASEGNDGIRFYVGDPNATNAITSLTVSGNAIVDARTGGIKATRVSTELPTPTPTGENSSGIVFDGTEGTVYGDVTLDEPLTVGEGETLTIPQGSTLNTNGKLTNNGTIVNKGTMNGDPGGIIVTAPTITTENLPDGTAGQSYTAPLEATGNNITWSASGLPTGLTLDADTGAITGTPATEGQFPVEITATNSAGIASKKYTLNIKPATVSVTGVKLDPTELSLFTGGSATLTVKVEPADATNQDVTCQSNNANVATVEGGTVKAVGEGEATIIVTTVDGAYTATCKVTVTQATYSISADISPDFGSVYTGYDRPAAQTVTVTNTGNQTLNLEQPASTNSFDVGNLSKTKLAPGGKATFTVQPKAGLAAGVYREEIQVSDSGNVTLSIPVSFSVQAAAAPQVTPAPAATPAPSDNITYYTCQACGYHNWTATEAGYRCDHCGYLESTRQLSGYGNVKGSYTPGSGAAAPAASTIPQTGDESNPVLWTVLLLVSGLALGGLAIAKRKKQQ